MSEGANVGQVIEAKTSFESFATNDNFIDQDYYSTESGVIIKDYHKEWVGALENNQKVAITAFTGSGKTSIPGVLYPLWRIFRDPETSILIISATLSQATRILNEIKHHIEHADYLKDLKPEDRSASWSKSKVEFTTGGEIKCKPVGNGAKAVKGAHVDLAICDEAAEFDDQEKFHRNVRTRVESQGGDICLISTPVHENDLMANVSEGDMPTTCKLCRSEAYKNDDGAYECPDHGVLNDHELDGGDNISAKGYWNKTYSVHEEVPEDEEGSFEVEGKNVKPLFPENFDRMKIMKLREENMTMFQKEYLCQPLAVEGDLFDPNDIIELYDNEESFSQNPRDDARYYMGADFAISHQGDYSVFTVIEVPDDGGKPVVRWIERLRGMGLDSQQDRIRDLHSIFNFEDIVLDETNFGSTAKKNLKQAGLPITGQDFKMKARNNLMVGLKNEIESEEFILPRGGERSQKLIDKLYNELLGFGTSETQSGSITYESTAKHDDTVMSLAMAVSSIERKQPVEAMLAY
jgi:hypothetical protein